MTTESRKRPLEADEDGSPAKRQRLPSSQTILSLGAPGSSMYSSAAVTSEELARRGLRRGIALALQQVGFESAAPEAMESFATLAETYLTSLIEDSRTYANAARRSHPVPRDFEQSLKRFNLTTSSLQPHQKPPVPRSKRRPKWEIFLDGDPLESDLPILGEELSGAPDKNTKPYIPESFPAFPSIHTYKSTPESVEAVTVSDDWGAFNPDLEFHPANGSRTKPPQPQRPLAPHEIPHGDPKKMREAAAKEAKAGEGALRRLMRASKIAKQKEVWSSAQRHPARRKRYNLWETAMRELIEDDVKSRGKEMAPSALHGDKGRFEIADHSMLVNWEKSYYRKDHPRAGVRKAAIAGHGAAANG